MSLTESYTGYCLSCIRDHLHKTKGFLREATKQWRRKGKVTDSIRRKVELAEEQLSQGETEHVWNVQLKDKLENRRLKEIGAKMSNIRKGLESTQIGFPHPNIPVKGTVEDLEKAQEEIDSAMKDVYEGITECKSCVSVQEFMKQMKVLKPETEKGKVLNTNLNNNSISDVKMAWRDIALTYGGQWVGKGVDKAIQYVVPQYDMPITVGLAVGLPILTKFVKLPKTVETAAILVGGFLSTKIMDYIEEAITPTPVVAYAPPPAAAARVAPPAPVPVITRTRYLVS